MKPLNSNPNPIYVTLSLKHKPYPNLKPRYESISINSNINLSHNPRYVTLKPKDGTRVFVSFRK